MTAVDPDATQALLRDRHPELVTRLDSHDVALLRAVYAARYEAHRRRIHMLAGALAQPVDLTRAQIDRLLQEGWLVNHVGLYVAPTAIRSLGTLLWTCIGCACTDEHSCQPGCWWSRPEVCSRCVNDPAIRNLGR